MLQNYRMRSRSESPLKEIDKRPRVEEKVSEAVEESKDMELDFNPSMSYYEFMRPKNLLHKHFNRQLGKAVRLLPDTLFDVAMYLASKKIDIWTQDFVEGAQTEDQTELLERMEDLESHFEENRIFKMFLEPDPEDEEQFEAIEIYNNWGDREEGYQNPNPIPNEKFLLYKLSDASTRLFSYLLPKTSTNRYVKWESGMPYPYKNTPYLKIVYQPRIKGNETYNEYGL